MATTFLTESDDVMLERLHKPPALESPLQTKEQMEKERFDHAQINRELQRLSGMYQEQAKSVAGSQKEITRLTSSMRANGAVDSTAAITAPHESASQRLLRTSLSRALNRN